MGEIIIKVPGDIKETFIIENEVKTQELWRIIENLKKELIFLNFLKKYEGQVSIDNITEKEVYLQDD